MQQSARAVERRALYLRSVLAMLGAVMFFSFMDMELKLLSALYPPMQVAALRGLTSLPLVFAYTLWRRALPSLFAVRWRLHLLRAGLSIVMLFLFSYSLRSLPLSDAYAIFFVAPLMITALSVPLLKEKVDASRWWAILLGLAGVIVVLRPGAGGVFTLAACAVLGTAACYAVAAITVRILSRTDSSESMVFWLTASLAFGAGALAAPDWVPLRQADWPMLAGLAATGFIAQLLVTFAFRHGEASSIAPLEYTALAWGAVIDWIVWHTLPDRFTLVGAVIIITSGIYLIRHQAGRAIAAESEHH